MTYRCLLGYNGTVAETSTGRGCQRWNVTFQDAKHFPDSSINDAANYCRNPNAKLGGPWCYVEKSSWETCGLDACLGKSLGEQNIKYVSKYLRKSKYLISLVGKGALYFESKGAQHDIY